jgi:hypothetical protein
VCESSSSIVVGGVLLILAHHGEAPGDAYAEYRKRRMVMLQGYDLNLLQSNRGLKRAIGIGIDASSKVTGRKGGSEDFYAVEVSTWTPELEKTALAMKTDLGLLKPGNVTLTTAEVDEFPGAAPSIKPDAKWQSMWRVHLPNGQVSDMTNLTRARDAARSLMRPISRAR